jgi:hypothetical protein
MKRIRLEVCPQRQAAKPWKVTKDGTLWGSCMTQADAIALGVTLGNQVAANGGLVTLKIKGRNGTIRDERTYPRSSDPKRSRG